MKKALSLILAVVLVFSMTTVAFAATKPQGYDCPQEGCEFWTDSYADMQKHIKDGCNRHFRPCQYGCGNGFATSDELADHEQDCWYGEITCDYCGTYFSPMRGYNEHSEVTCDYCGAYFSPVREFYTKHEKACKDRHFGIPVYKILKAIENFIRTTDWNKIINTVVDVLNKVIGTVKPIISDLVAKIPAPEVPAMNKPCSCLGISIRFIAMIILNTLM